MAENQDAMGALQESLRKAHSRLRHLEDIEKKLSKSHDVMRAELEAIAAQLGIRDFTIYASFDDKGGIRARLAELFQERDGLLTQVDELALERNALRDDLHRAEAERDAELTHAEVMQAEAKKAQDRCRELEGQKATLRKRLEDLGYSALDVLSELRCYEEDARQLVQQFAPMLKAMADTAHPPSPP